MENLSEMATRIKALRASQTQAEFAERLGVRQATVSSWESGQDIPAPLSCLLLGLLASSSEREWFFKSIGPDLQTMMTAADAILKERSAPPVEAENIRIKCVRRTAGEMEETGDSLSLPVSRVPNRLSTVCLVVGENEASPLVSSGDIIVLDISQKGAENVRPLCGEIVLADAKGSANLTGWARGLLIGKLLVKRFARSVSQKGPSHLFVATIGPFGDSETVWEPRDVQAIRLGEWAHLVKTEVLHPISHDSGKYPRGIHDLPADLAMLFHSFKDPISGAPIARPVEVQGLATGESEVPGKIRLYPGCQILGIVRALFPAPIAKAEE